MQNASEGADTASDPGRAPWRRFHPVALTVTVLIGAGWLFGPTALSTPTGVTPEGVSLEVGWGYVLMAPAANLLDALSVLTLGQHYAVLATLILAYAAWRLLRRRRRLGWLRRVGAEVGVSLLSLAGLLAVYGYGVVGPRPMAALAVDDPEVLVLDVHSHTAHSHDGRPGFDVEDNRAWHAGAGFDAVYVSDHRTWAGWREGVGSNPQLAGRGTVLLPALEIVLGTKYASALGEPWRYEPAMDGNHLIPDSLYALVERGGPRPTLVFTIPEQLDSVPRSTPDSIGFVAIEVSDASPRGLRQSRVDRPLLLRMVDSLDLAPVAATNNHGWGRTAAAWTLMPVPGWRELAPDQLSAAIEERFHQERRNATTVVERRSPWLGESPGALTLTAPAVLWQMFGGMGGWERLSWLVWAWVLAFALAGLRRRRRVAGKG